MPEFNFHPSTALDTYRSVLHQPCAQAKPGLQRLLGEVTAQEIRRTVNTS
jgi:hypothetical protein